MARQYHVTGEHMVYVRNWYMPGARNTTDASSEEEVFFVELGMTSESTQITVNYGQTDVYTDDYVPGAPAEVLTGMYRDAFISMTLVHFDEDVLNMCIANAAGSSDAALQGSPGVPMGRWKDVTEEGCFYVELYLQPAIRFGLEQGLVTARQEKPWKFFHAYLQGNWTYPIGAEKSLVKLQWRAVPYYKPTDISATTEIKGSEGQLFDRVSALTIITPAEALSGLLLSLGIG